MRVTQRIAFAVLSREIARYRRLQAYAVALHDEPCDLPDRRERWLGAIRALERVRDELRDR